MEKVINRLSKSVFNMLRIGIKRLNTYSKMLAIEKPTIWVTGLGTAQNGPFGYFLPYFLGPRWNCAAMTASIGPLKVKKVITIDTINLMGADSWTLLILDTDLKPIARSVTTQTDRIRSFTVPEGNHWVMIRYYASNNHLPVPEVRTDGKLIAPRGIFENEQLKYQAFLDGIRGNTSMFFRFLHLHSFSHIDTPVQQHRDQSKQQFLPLGSPETVFRFGRLPAGEALFVDVSEELYQRAKVYIVFYNTASFPVAWHTLEKNRNSLLPMPSKAFYLIRTVPRLGCKVTEETVDKSLNITVGKHAASLLPSNTHHPGIADFSKTIAESDRIKNGFRSK